MIWAVLGVASGVILVGWLIYIRFQVTPPNPHTALVFSGGGLWGFKGTDGVRLRVVVRRTQFVPPPHRGQRRLSLLAEPVEIDAPGCETKQMLRVDVVMTASYRIGDKEEYIRRAASRLPIDEDKMKHTVRNIMQTKLTEVISETEHMDFILNRPNVSARVREAIIEEFAEYGLVVADVGIKRVGDVDQYGEARRAAAQREAQIQMLQAEHAGDLEMARLKHEAELEESRQEKKKLVEQERLETETAKEKHKMIEQRNAVEIETDRMDADRVRRRAELKAEQDLQAEAARKALAEKAHETREAEIKTKELVSEFERHRSAADRDALIASELKQKWGEARIRELLINAEAIAPGLMRAAQVKDLRPEQAEALVLLTLVENMPGIAAGSRPDLSGLKNVIQQGGDPSGVLNQLLAVGFPLADVAGDLLSKLRQVAPAQLLDAVRGAEPMSPGEHPPPGMPEEESELPEEK